MVIKVGINGFGRVGRVVFRTCLEHPDIEISAINDPAIEVEYVCYLIKFDSTHGTLKRNVTHTDDEITIDELRVKVFQEKLPSNVPWHTAGVQYVIEASGMFTSLEKASGHLGCDGVKRVIVTAPSVDVPMAILGVNDIKIKPEYKVISCGSSTLYCLAPIVKVLEDNYGVEEGFITSIHAMTPSLKPLDGLCLRGKHWRDHRSITQNIIPAVTGACKALGRIIPSVRDKMCGLAFRVPIANVSVLDLTVRLKKFTSIENIVSDVEKMNKSCKQTIITTSREEAVSSDFIGDSHSCILDVGSSMQLKPNSYKLICWYENEYSYACRVVDLIFFSEAQFRQQSKNKTTYVRPKTSKKQDGVQQTECVKDKDAPRKETAEVKTKDVPDIKSRIEKPLPRPVLMKKPVITQNPIPMFHSDADRRVELFKIWKDDDKMNKSNTVRQNLTSFFQIYNKATPQTIATCDCSKAQERLEKVKKEFSKMVGITEHLLRKSNNSKLSLETLQQEAVDALDITRSNEVKTDKKEFKNQLEKIYKNKPLVPRNPSKFDAKGDGEVSVSTLNSKNSFTDCSKDAEGSFSYEKDQSMYSMMNESSTNARSDFHSSSQSECSKELEKVLDKVYVENEKAPDEIYSNKNSLSKTINNFLDGFSKNFQFQHFSNKNDTDLHKNKDQPTEEKCESEISNKHDQEKETEDNKTEFIKTTDTVIANKEFTTQRLTIKVDNILNKENTILVPNPEVKDASEVTTDSHDSKLNTISLVDKHVISNKDTTTDEQSTRTEQTQDCDGSVNVLTDECSKNGDVQKRQGSYTSICESFGVLLTDDVSRCSSPHYKSKQDIFDKLDSDSASESDSSFDINKKKSQVIKIGDLTNSLDDLDRLDKICRIMEISDELSDKLFSALDQNPDATSVSKKRWSFKDLCERINLDEFCNNVFGK